MLNDFGTTAPPESEFSGAQHDRRPWRNVGRDSLAQLFAVSTGKCRALTHWGFPLSGLGKLQGDGIKPQRPDSEASARALHGWDP
jgi:hypothetical protein